MMIKESQILIPAAFCILMQTQGAAARLFLFFLGSSGCHRNTSRCLLLYMVSTGTDVGMDGNEVSCQESKEALSYADYLPVYYKSFAKYQDSDMNQRIIFAECLPPHLKLHIIHQKLQRSPLQNGADSRMAISLGLMLFRKPPGLCRPC